MGLHPSISFSIDKCSELGHINGSITIDARGECAVRIDLDEHDELVVAARLARELLACCEDLPTSDEPSTRADARELLVHLIADATAYVAMLDAEDRCTCTLALVDGRAELRAVTPCPSHPDAPRAEPDTADMGRIMAGARGDETEMYP